MQNGGMLIVTAGGEKVLLSFKQTSPGHHVANNDILEVLGISDGVKEDGGEGAATAPSEEAK